MGATGLLASYHASPLTPNREQEPLLRGISRRELRVMRVVRSRWTPCHLQPVPIRRNITPLHTPVVRPRDTPHRNHHIADLIRAVLHMPRKQPGCCFPLTRLGSPPAPLTVSVLVRQYTFRLHRSPLSNLDNPRCSQHSPDRPGLPHHTHTDDGIPSRSFNLTTSPLAWSRSALSSSTFARKRCSRGGPNNRRPVTDAPSHGTWTDDPSSSHARFCHALSPLKHTHE